MWWLNVFADGPISTSLAPLSLSPASLFQLLSLPVQLKEYKLYSSCLSFWRHVASILIDSEHCRQTEERGGERGTRKEENYGCLQLCIWGACSRERKERHGSLCEQWSGSVWTLVVWQRKWSVNVWTVASECVGSTRQWYRNKYYKNTIRTLKFLL